jgi:hypothetical protein
LIETTEEENRLEKLDEQLYVEARKNVKSDIFPESEDLKVPYHEIERLPYEGELRLGTYLTLSEDIYSVLFACNIRSDLIRD